MRQFEVFTNPVASARAARPFLVVLSSHHLLGLDDVVVAPLTNLRSRALGGLEIEVELDGHSLVLLTADLASISAHRLRHRIGELASYEDEIRRALDRLFTGF